MLYKYETGNTMCNKYVILWNCDCEMRSSNENAVPLLEFVSKRIVE
jgi:hypothetical protein